MGQNTKEDIEKCSVLDIGKQQYTKEDIEKYSGLDIRKKQIFIEETLMSAWQGVKDFSYSYCNSSSLNGCSGKGAEEKTAGAAEAWENLCNKKLKNAEAFIVDAAVSCHLGLDRFLDTYDIQGHERQICLYPHEQAHEEPEEAP